MLKPDNDTSVETLTAARGELAQLATQEKLALLGTVDTDEADLAALIALAEWDDPNGDYESLTRAELAEIFTEWRQRGAR